MSNEFILEMKNISKDYYGNKVLKDVHLNIKPGEIHALLGENGAGKSTLMNILFGMPVIHGTGGFEGEILLDGQSVSIKSPKHAMDLGIGMVHQEFMLIPGFSVTENIKLNRELTIPNSLSKVFGKGMEWLDKDAMENDARQALDTIGVDISEHSKVRGLPVGHMQFIEIAREVDKKGMRLLVFDEPTAVLNEIEASRLLDAMKHLSSLGIAIVFITHRLDEVINVCDSVTILRDGEFVTSKAVANTDVLELAKLMIGRSVSYSDITGRDDFKDDDIILEMKDLRVHMPGEMVKGVDLKVRRGEILGIGGLAGQGKLGIPNGVMGLYPSQGKITYNGKDLPLNNTKAVLESKISFLSEDRKQVGLILNDSIEDNIAFSAMQINNEFLHKFGLFTFKDKNKTKKYANQMIDELDIRCTGRTQPSGSLSGGNQQKVCLAKALALKPDVVFVSEPTRGIDIGAKKLVLDMLQKLSWEQGVTVVMVSSELAELRSICDRIAIVVEGKIADILSPKADDTKFGLAMSGAKEVGGVS